MGQEYSISDSSAIHGESGGKGKGMPNSRLPRMTKKKQRKKRTLGIV